MAKRSTTYEERMQIVERHKNGESLPAIARSMSLNRFTTRKWWRIYRNQGWDGLHTKLGRKPSGVLSSYDSLIKYAVLRLKREHPGWGLDVLLLQMSRRPSIKGKKLPKRSALNNYLKPYYHRFGSMPRYPTGRPEQPKQTSKAVHECWQMDFKGSVKIKGVGKAMPFNVCDAFCSAPLQGVVYTHPKANPLSNVTWRDIQNNLRRTFTKWGMPLQLKMDRDPLFIGSSRFEWPSSLLLWLVGLGIQPIVNPKATPTKNTNVERINRTWFNHVGWTTLEYSSQALQKATDQAWNDRRLHLPSRNPKCKNQPPMVALPELKHSTRYFDPQKETQIFDMNKVYQYLSQWTWKRQIDTHGRISLGGNQRAISKDHIGQIVKVLFVPSTGLFEAIDLNGNILKSFSIPNITLEYLNSNGGIT